MPLLEYSRRHDSAILPSAAILMPDARCFCFRYYALSSVRHAAYAMLLLMLPSCRWHFARYYGRHYERPMARLMPPIRYCPRCWYPMPDIFAFMPPLPAAAIAAVAADADYWYSWISLTDCCAGAGVQVGAGRQQAVYVIYILFYIHVFMFADISWLVLNYKKSICWYAAEELKTAIHFCMSTSFSCIPYMLWL